MATQTFTCFGRLPPELRTRIYLFATPPRVVLLKKKKVLDHDYWRGYWRAATGSQHGNFPEWIMSGKHCIYGPTKIPGLLHTCRESRAELMKHGYELAFGTESAGPQTWFNYRWDALYLSGYLASGHFPIIIHSWEDSPSPCSEYGQMTPPGLFATFEDKRLGDHCLLEKDKKRVRWVVGRDESTLHISTGEAFDIDGNPATFLATDKRSEWDFETQSAWSHF